MKTGWHFDNVDFESLTLLVGASGVGKTKIIRAINDIKSIALGHSVKKSMKWFIRFEDKGIVYSWEGITNSNENMDKFTDSKYEFIKEALVKENRLGEKLVILERNADKITFLDNVVPKTSLNKSLVSIFSEEEEIETIISAFEKIYIFDFDVEKFIGVATALTEDGEVYDNLAEKKEHLEVIQASKLPIMGKLVQAYDSFPLIFEDIKNEFISIFERVEDLRFHTITRFNKENNEDEIVYNLQLKEKGTDNWVNRSEISAGMHKTLLFIALIKLTSDDTVIIIDEFENSLGVNCIDLVADEVVGNIKQFILTSHHPYIINRISYDFWKIVTRTAGTVTVKSADQYRLGRAKHEAFKQLLNLDAYVEGSEDF
ncbi:AAA family ATPase [Bacillus albus]|uniref:AAA family ATPase n=2 Tax=Bacillus TaxID=1386 RepID=UPI0013E90419|nr:AAA family ATPase [Bacillus albus]